MYTKSEELFGRAQAVIPGGVNSPVRAFKSVGGTPVFIEHASGAYLYDEDGNRYIDYINSWGPMILGHAHPKVIEAIRKQAERGSSYGAPTLLEIEMAELLKSMVPNIELVRMVNSGTEACMSAIRLARGFTGRNKILKFEGCYHGHADSFLIKAGSGLATLHIQSVPGVTAGVAEDTLTAPFNDLDAVKELFDRHAAELAAVIIEPVAGNMGCIPPRPGFLEGIRELCTREGVVFILDEVMTGFRLHAGGAQALLGIEADLLTYGKIIGAGLPVGAFGGKREIMECIAPVGKVYQAGTLSGNPIAMAAGLALLSELRDHPETYEELEEKGAYLQRGLEEELGRKGLPFQINRVGSMISVHFSRQPVVDFTTAAASDLALFNKFFHFMLAQGVYLPPSAYESWFISNAITYQDLDRTIEAASRF